MTTPTQKPGPTFRGQPVKHVVDVRSKLEFWMGHLDGATNIPVDVVAVELEARTGARPKDAILVYCASGARSAAAAAALRAKGFTNVIDGGGIASAGAAYFP